MTKLKSKLRPHQERAVNKLLMSDQPGLIFAHQLGSGKTISSIAAHLKSGLPADVVVPASLKRNYQKNIDEHVLGKSDIKIHSLQSVARGKSKLTRPLLIVDEAHWLRNPVSATAKALRASEAKKKVLLTGSPMYNHPSDLATLVNIVANKTELPESPSKFKKKYLKESKVGPGFFGKMLGVKPGTVVEVNPDKKTELEEKLRKYVDFHHQSTKHYPSVTEEVVKVPLSRDQQDIHDTVLGKAPFWVRWKVRYGIPPDKRESARLNSFMSVSRQVSNTTSGFSKSKNPSQPKIDAAHESLVSHLNKNPEGKAVIYSNFLRSGIDQYRKKLVKSGIPHAEFSGRVTAKDRAKAVEDYNKGDIKALLVSRAGSEGLDLKGTSLVQILEPHWNEERQKQVIGRAARFKSHDHLPESRRKVHVQRFLTSRVPKGFFESIGLKSPGFSTDEYIHQRSMEKENLNQQFMGMLGS